MHKEFNVPSSPLSAAFAKKVFLQRIPSYNVDKVNNKRNQDKGCCGFLE